MEKILMGITASSKHNLNERNWYKVDATEKVLGRIASNIAIILQGKNKVNYTKHVDTGDYVVVINADKISITGDKANKTMHYTHTGYPGGIKSASMGELMAKDSTKVLHQAVKRMLPKGPLGRDMLKKLKIYKDENHLHAAQKLQEWPFN